MKWWVIIIFLLLALMFYQVYLAYATAPVEAPKRNICHKTSSPTHPWEAIRIDEASWPTHQTHGDFNYSGPLKQNGHPDDAHGADDTWCGQNSPEPPESPPNTPTTPQTTDTPTQVEESVTSPGK